MSLRRAIRSFTAYGLGLGVTLVTQFALPPIFLRSYGVSGYAAWVILSTTVVYMSTLNFGVTTYAVNRLTIMRQRGETEDFQNIQASSAWLILAIVTFGCLLILGSFAVPLDTVLHVQMESSEVHWTVFWLAMQGIMHVFAGYYNNLFTVVERPDQAIAWYNYRRLSTLFAVPMAWAHGSFAWIAFCQFGAVCLVTLISILYLKRSAPTLNLSLRGGSWPTARKALVPSGMFGLIFLQQILLFESPLLIFQWILGPTAVVSFAVCRTLFSAARQMLSMITNAISPEITFAYGAKDRKRLLSIFHESERLIYALIPIANCGVFVFGPVLLAVWMPHQRLFDMRLYLLMAFVSATMSVKEHKQWFQFATNQHRRLGWTVFIGAVLLVALGTPLTILFGLYAFMLLWLVLEIVQTLILFNENLILMNHDASITAGPVYRLIAFMISSTALTFYILKRTMAQDIAIEIFGGILLLTVTSIVCFFLFRLGPLCRKLLIPIRARLGLLV